MAKRPRRSRPESLWRLSSSRPHPVITAAPGWLVLLLAGQPADVASFMPLVLINPQVTALGDPVTGPEGCLSFPEVYADITRSESVSVAALNDAGEGIEFKAGGLLARAIQHEADHLNGILFIDRMSAEAKNELKPQLESLQNATKAVLQKK